MWRWNYLSTLAASLISQPQSTMHETWHSLSKRISNCILTTSTFQLLMRVVLPLLCPLELISIVLWLTSSDSRRKNLLNSSLARSTSNLKWQWLWGRKIPNSLALQHKMRSSTFSDWCCSMTGQPEIYYLGRLLLSVLLTPRILQQV